jgi:lipocalin
MSSFSERTSHTKDPISFATAGIKPDTSITVFDQAFHVYSLFLKIHSTFFRKFLDSPEKKGNTSTNPAFQYEWVTKVDDDGTWSLVCAPSFPEASSLGRIERLRI